MVPTPGNPDFDCSNASPFFNVHSIHHPDLDLWYQNPFPNHPFYMRGAGFGNENPYFPRSVALNECPGFPLSPSPWPTKANSRSPVFFRIAPFGHCGDFGKKMKNQNTQTDPQWNENKCKKQDIRSEADSCARDGGISLYDLACGRARPGNVEQHNLLSGTSCESKDALCEEGITCKDERVAAVLSEQCPVVRGNKENSKPDSGKKMSLAKEMKSYGAAPRILSPSDEEKPGDKAQSIKSHNPLQSEVCESTEDVCEGWSDEEWGPLDLCEEALPDLSLQPHAQHPLSDGERKLDTGPGSHGSPQRCLPLPIRLDSFDCFADKAVSCNMSMFKKNLYRVVPPEEYLAWCKMTSGKSQKSHCGVAVNLGEKKDYRAVPRVLSPSDKLKARDQAQSTKSQNTLSSGGCKTTEDVSDEEDWKPMYFRSEKCKQAENVREGEEEEEEEEEKWKPVYLCKSIKNRKYYKDEEETETEQVFKNCAKIKRKVKGRKLEGLNSSNQKTTCMLKKNGALNILLCEDSAEWEMEEEAEDDELYEEECLFQEVSPQDPLPSQGRFYLEVGRRIIWKPPKSSLPPQLIVWPTRNKHQLKCGTYKSIPVVFKVKGQEGSGTTSGRLQKKCTMAKQEAAKSKRGSQKSLRSNSKTKKGPVLQANRHRDSRI